jgi:acyl dehydratase
LGRRKWAAGHIKRGVEMEGPWIKMQKTPESSDPQREGLPVVTLIHDDEVASGLGFTGGFVGGPNLEGVMAAAIPASFGHQWYEGGVHSVRIFKPVFTGEEVRVVWEDCDPDPGDRRKIKYWLEKKNGENAAAGWAAIGESVEKLAAPWERNPARAMEPADDILPSTRLGSKLPAREAILTRDLANMGMDRVQDTNWWFRIASPWGDPLLPPYLFGSMVLRYIVEAEQERGNINEARPLWMYAGLDLIVYRPVFIDHAYRIEGRVVEKGRSSKSVFVVRECDIDNRDGVRVARARFKASLLEPD